MLSMLICNPPGLRVFEFMIAVIMIVTGLSLYCRARRGKVIGFVAAIGHERVVWTKIVAAVLILFGTMTLISAAFKLDC
jgi:hypothetical protein